MTSTYNGSFTMRQAKILFSRAQVYACGVGPITYKIAILTSSRCKVKVISDILDQS